MGFRTIKIAGIDAPRVPDEHRARYPASRGYPFLIGDAEELEFPRESADGEDCNPAAILRASGDVAPAARISGRRADAEEDGYLDEDEIAGEWPGGEVEKAGIGLHKDVVTGKFKPEVYLGLADIEEPWQLPAALNYGGWNECPPADVHAALHREWLREYGAEIVGMSHDVVECLVKNPPRDRGAAMEPSWGQYWYCADIVDQGCGSIANLAAVLPDAQHRYFRWD